MRLPDDLVLRSVSLQDQYFDLRGLSAYSSLSSSTLRGHIRKAGLPVYQLCGKLLIKRSEFDNWMARFRTNKSQDLDLLADEVLKEIGSIGRRSKKVTT